MSESGPLPQPKRWLRLHGISLRDVLVTIGIGLFILGVVYAFGSGRNSGDTSFRVVPYVGGIASGPAPELGQLPQDFEIPLLGGGTFRLSEQKGKRVWLNFWASWCPPCRAEMPDIQRVWEEVQNQDVVILAINFGESPQTAGDYIARNKFTFPVGLDPGSRVATEYRLAGLPSHFFIDGNGILREIRLGLINLEGMRQRLEKLKGF